MALYGVLQKAVLPGMEEARRRGQDRTQGLVGGYRRAAVGVSQGGQKRWGQLGERTGGAVRILRQEQLCRVGWQLLRQHQFRHFSCVDLPLLQLQAVYGAFFKPGGGYPGGV